MSDEKDTIAARWGHYFLRYCAGTVVGAIIVGVLAKKFLNSDAPFWNYINTISDGKIELGAATITVFIGLGFTYCYIASAPGAVFHAARGLFYKRNLSSLRYLFVIPLAGTLFLILLFTHSSAFSLLPPLGTIWMPFAGLVVGIFVFLLQCGLLLRIFTDLKHVRDFYKAMTLARSKNEDNHIQHYRKSYRDLREHGNAFEIIILELVLAATLFLLKDYFLIVLCIWILPAAFCWIVGTLLEFTIPDSPNR